MAVSLKYCFKYTNISGELMLCINFSPQGRVIIWILTRFPIGYINISSHRAISLEGHMSRLTLVRRENT